MGVGAKVERDLGGPSLLPQAIARKTKLSPIRSLLTLGAPIIGLIHLIQAYLIYESSRYSDWLITPDSQYHLLQRYSCCRRTVSLVVGVWPVRVRRHARYQGQP